MFFFRCCYEYVLPRCQLSYAKMMQAECRTSSLLVRYAEVPAILCKVTEKIIQLQILDKKILDSVKM